MSTIRCLNGTAGGGGVVKGRSVGGFWLSVDTGFQKHMETKKRCY